MKYGTKLNDKTSRLLTKSGQAFTTRVNEAVGKIMKRRQGWEIRGMKPKTGNLGIWGVGDTVAAL